MNWSLLFSTYGLIFIAELGDKTQLAVMTQTCKYRSPLPVLIGGSLALTLVSAVGVVGGQVAGRLIPAEVVRAVAAAAFVIMGALIWRESVKLKRQAEAEACEIFCEIDETVRQKAWNWKAFSSTLILLFLAEFGDKTQLAVMGLASKAPAPWTIFAGAALALTTVTALGVIGGRQLCRVIPEQLLLKISGIAFIIMGVLMGTGIF